MSHKSRIMERMPDINWLAGGAEKYLRLEGAFVWGVNSGYWQKADVGF
jgi:hypothetical protein